MSEKYIETLRELIIKEFLAEPNAYEVLVPLYGGSPNRDEWHCSITNWNNFCEELGGSRKSTWEELREALKKEGVKLLNELNNKNLLHIYRKYCRNIFK